MSPTDAKPKKIVDVTSMQHFKTLAAEPRLSVVHFWASWANQVHFLPQCFFRSLSLVGFPFWLRFLPSYFFLP